MNMVQAQVQGTLKPDGTLELDEKPNLPPGRVQISIQLVTQQSIEKVGWWEYLQQIRKDQAARGHKARTKEEVDAHLKELDDEWEERLARLQRIHEESHRAREQERC